MAANDIKNIDLLYDVAYKKINDQNDANRSIDAKVGVLFGFVGVIAVWLMEVVISNKNVLGWNAISVGLLFLMISVVLCIFAARSRTFRNPIDLHQVYSEQYLAKKHIDLKNQIVSDLSDTYDKNQAIVVVKSYFFDAAIVTAGVAIILFLIHLVI